MYTTTILLLLLLLYTTTTTTTTTTTAAAIYTTQLGLYYICSCIIASNRQIHRCTTSSGHRHLCFRYLYVSTNMDLSLCPASLIRQLGGVGTLACPRRETANIELRCRPPPQVRFYWLACALHINVSYWVCLWVLVPPDVMVYSKELLLLKNCPIYRYHIYIV